MGGKHFQQIHTNAGGGSQSGAGRDFGSQEEVGGKVSAEILEHRERNLQATAFIGQSGQGGEVTPVAKQAKIGRDDLDAAIATVSQNGVEVLVNGSAENGAPNCS